MTREEKFEKAVYDYFKKIEERMNGFDYFNHEHIYTVTHWMPVPQLPNEKNE